MKKLLKIDLNEILNKGFEELTEEEMMIISLKQAINKLNTVEDTEKDFYEEFIAMTYEQLKLYGWTF